MRFIRIQEATRHAAYVTDDEIIREIDVKTNPLYGYSNVEACISQLKNPQSWGAKGFVPFPVQSPMGPVTFHIDGRMDFAHNLVWKEPGHRCSPSNKECRDDMTKVALNIPLERKL